MPGRIHDEDVALVKERAAIAEVVGERVTLRRAGGGSLKGLCPFHDEKTPSFNVRPAVGAYHCFGCGEGGDVISFVMKVDHLTFAEAVERLADSYGVQLRYAVEGEGIGGVGPGQRRRLLEAHRVAADFYAEQLTGRDALVARRFLAERGFDRDAAAHFGVGYAPRDDGLLRHLRGRGFSLEELSTAGLARDSRRGPADRFSGRLVWPIRDITGDVVGFGARRLHDDDFITAKYLNTPETPLYKKSTVLYGVDLAKREIARERRVVVVEGYTDVMACHLAGVTTAVATCGTAFGDEHIRVLRRLLVDAGDLVGEVVFTFDGDEAGRKAALRAFGDDQKFVGQTFVAVQPDGLDPCDLRVQRGDEAVRELVGRRVRLVEFAVRSALDRHDLDTPEGRVAALAATAPMVAAIKDPSLRPEYTRTLAGWLGMELAPVQREVARAGRRRGEGRGSAPPAPPAPDGPPDGGATVPRPAALPRPRPDDPALLVEREALKLVLQHPDLAGSGYDALSEECFTAPAYLAVHAAVVRAGGAGTAAPGGAWVEAVTGQVEEAGRPVVRELAVESLRAAEPDERYAAELLARLEERALVPRIADLRSRLQRLDPDDPQQQSTFAALVRLEQQRRLLQARALGEA